MTFHAEFNYAPDQREKLLRLLHGDGLKVGAGLKVKGAWVAAQTGTGYALLETDDASSLYALCTQWTDCGRVTLTPVVAAADV